MQDPIQRLGQGMLIAGLVLTILGGALWALGRGGFRGLPGDLFWPGKQVSVYFPLATCVVLSVLLSAALWLIQWLSGR